MKHQKKVVYKLVHMYEREEGDEIKELGIYSTHKKAEEAIDRYKLLEGFNEHPVDCFCIDECELDKDAEWTDGFTNSVLIEQDFLKFSQCFKMWLQGLGVDDVHLKSDNTSTYIDFEINNELLYDLECELYEDVCLMKRVDDIANYIRKIFEKKFEKIEITFEQYENLASILLYR